MTHAAPGRRADLQDTTLKYRLQFASSRATIGNKV